MKVLPLSLIISLLLPADFAAAATTAAPDWPCVQRKVDDIPASQIWDGPPLEAAMKVWQDDDKTADAVKKLVSRRGTIEEAIASAEKYADSLPDAERNAKLVSLFAGIYETLAAERRTIISGIEKYNKRQQERASVIEDKGKKIAELEAEAGSDETKLEMVAKLQEDYDWETRVFKERNDNIPIACELPVLIDQRLFELAKAVRGKMKD